MALISDDLLYNSNDELSNSSASLVYTGEKPIESLSTNMPQNSFQLLSKSVNNSKINKLPNFGYKNITKKSKTSSTAHRSRRKRRRLLLKRDRKNSLATQQYSMIR